MKLVLSRDNIIRNIFWIVIFLISISFLFSTITSVFAGGDGGDGGGDIGEPSCGIGGIGGIGDIGEPGCGIGGIGGIGDVSGIGGDGGGDTGGGGLSCPCGATWQFVWAGKGSGNEWVCNTCTTPPAPPPSGGGGGGGGGNNPPLPQCSNGADDDGDGLIDYVIGYPAGSDLGCSSPTDNDESNPSPNLQITADPIIIRKGGSSSVTWDAKLVTKCTVSNPSIISSKDVTPYETFTGTYNATNIQEETTYTLKCVDFNGNSLSVYTGIKILPVFEEF